MRDYYIFMDQSTINDTVNSIKLAYKIRASISVVQAVIKLITTRQLPSDFPLLNEEIV
jgi:hypothetical protein